MDDARAVARILETGDPSFFRILVERHGERVKRIVASVLGPFLSGEVEDAAQDVFLKAFLSLRQFEGRSSFATWIARIAFHHALDVRESGLRRPAALPVAFAAEVRSASEPLAEVQANERSAAVARALEGLPDLYRSVINMHYWLGMTIDEIADSLDVPANTVKSYLFRARAILRPRLSREGVPSDSGGGHVWK